MNRSILAVAALLAVAGSAFAGAHVVATIAIPGESHTVEAYADEEGNAGATIDGAPIESYLPTAPPALPDLPPVPVIPGAPAIPAAPEVPGLPGTPEAPGLPAAPEVPAAPELPADPGLPTPALPTTPEVPTLPTEPAPEVPATPELPTAPSMPTPPSSDEITEEANEAIEDLLATVNDLVPV